MVKHDQPEWRLSHYVNSLLEKIILEPCWLTAVDTGTQMVHKTQEARFAAEARRKARGIRPAHLDWYVYQFPIFSQFELKYGHTKPDPNQETTIELLTKRDIPTGTYCTVLQVYEHVKRAGFKLHGNAENIAHEIELRWRAADEAKRGAATVKKPRKSKPRATKPTLQQVRKLTRMRAQVRF